MFKAPENLWIVILGGVWLILLVRQLLVTVRARRAAFANQAILHKIVGHQPTKRPVFKWLLMGLAFVLITVTLARPIGGLTEETVSGAGLDLVVLFDISQSMSAMDIEGHSRLEVGKVLVERLLGSLRRDRVGLVVFAGDTMVQCPLTHDKNAFLTFLQRLDPSLLTKQGTNLAGAIETGIDRFDQTASQSKVLVLVSDGEDQDQERLDKALAEAKRKNIFIYTVGIGSTRGAPIPIARNVWGELQYKVHKGKQVITKLDDTVLKKIAKESGGKAFRTSDEKSAMDVAKALEGLKRVAMASGTVVTQRELYPIPALLAFLILLLEWMISERIPYTREKDHWLKRL
jgi:Ca-activated chloride channel family protein